MSLLRKFKLEDMEMKQKYISGDPIQITKENFVEIITDCKNFMDEYDKLLRLIELSKGGIMKKKRFQFVWWWPYIHKHRCDEYDTNYGEFIVGCPMRFSYHKLTKMDCGNNYFLWSLQIGPLEIRRWK